MNKVIRTARISAEPVVLPIHVDRGLVDLAFEATTEAFTEADFEAAQAQDLEESAEFTPLGENAETVDVEEVEEEEPKLTMEEAEALVLERLGEAEARFLQEKEQEKEAAHQAGFEAGQAQGYAEGHAAGLAEGQTQSQDEIVRFQAMLNHIADRWDHVFKSADMDVTQLAFAVAKNIVGSVVDAHDDLVLQSVRDCLAHVQDTTQLTIYVNPEDLALVRNNRTHWQEAYERIESLNIEADESIEKGGCLIETPSGDIDAQISSRLEKLQAAILERLQGAPQEMAPDVSDVVAEENVGERVLENETPITDELESVSQGDVDTMDKQTDAEMGVEEGVQPVDAEAMADVDETASVDHPEARVQDGDDAMHAELNDGTVAEENVPPEEDAVEAVGHMEDGVSVDDPGSALEDDADTIDAQLNDETMVDEDIPSVDGQTEDTDEIENDVSDLFLPEDVDEEVVDTQTNEGTTVEEDAEVLEDALEMPEEMTDDVNEVSADLEDGLPSDVDDGVDGTPESEDDEAGQL